MGNSFCPGIEWQWSGQTGNNQFTGGISSNLYLVRKPHVVFSMILSKELERISQAPEKRVCQRLVASQDDGVIIIVQDGRIAFPQDAEGAKLLGTFVCD